MRPAARADPLLLRAALRRIAAALLCFAAAAAAQVTLDNCRETPGAFRVNGTLRGSPCPVQVTSAAATGSRVLYSCHIEGVVLCDGGGGNSTTVDCADLGFLGCARTPGHAAQVKDVSFSPDGRALYVSCFTQLRRCDWDAAAGVAANCAKVDGADCPAYLPFIQVDEISGVVVPRDSPSYLVLACHSMGIRICPLTAPGSGTLAGPCREGHPPQSSPCGSLIPVTQYADLRHQSLSMDRSGSEPPKLHVGCGDFNYTSCSLNVSAVAAVSNCSLPNCTQGNCVANLGLPPCNVNGLAELPSGLTAVMCRRVDLQASPRAYFVCGATNSPTASPTVPPSDNPSTASPSLAPSAAPTGAPLASPPTAGPSTAKPTSAPTASPEGSPTLPPPPLPSAGPSRPGRPPPPPPSPPPGALTTDSCASLHCLDETVCRAASTCIVALSGRAFCVAGENRADGLSCDDTLRTTTGDRCVQGVCVGDAGGCELTPECRRGHDPQCASIDCDTGRCRRIARNEGRECDSPMAGAPRGACRDGVCVLVDLCRDVHLCDEPPQCRKRQSCDHSVGECPPPTQAVADGTPCLGLQVAVAEDVCSAGECGSYAAMQVSDFVVLQRDGQAARPVAALAPETPLSPVRSACAAADGSRDSDWADGRLGIVTQEHVNAAGSDVFNLSALGGSWGDVVMVFDREVTPASVGVVDSPRHPSRAPVQIHVSGCVAEEGALSRVALASQAASCGGRDNSAALAELAAAMLEVQWRAAPATEAVQPAGAAVGASRWFSVTAPGAYRCIRLRPLAICGGACSRGTWFTAAVVFGLSTAALFALGCVAFAALALGCGWRRRVAAEPPPLTGRTVEDVLTRCLDAFHPLAVRWERSKYTLLSEMTARAVAPCGVDPASCLAALLHQEWRVELDGTLAELPDSMLIALRLYSQEPQDIDREFQWADAPHPGPCSYGHGMEKKDDSAAWEQYREAHALTGGARNQNHYRVPNRASFLLCASLRWTSLDKYEGWVKFVAALTCAAASCCPSIPVSPASGQVELIRMLGRLPADVRGGYDKLRPGELFALPSLSSTSTAKRAELEFMGQHPAMAVMLRLRFAPGRLRGADLKKLSMYPLEAEVLLPMFSVFKVAARRRPRELGGVVNLPEWKGAKGLAQRALLHVRAAVRPILVLEAVYECSLWDINADAARFLDKVRADSESSSAALWGCMCNAAPAGARCVPPDCAAAVAPPAEATGAGELPGGGSLYPLLSPAAAAGAGAPGAAAPPRGGPLFPAAGRWAGPGTSPGRHYCAAAPAGQLQQQPCGYGADPSEARVALLLQQLADERERSRVLAEELDAARRRVDYERAAAGHWQAAAMARLPPPRLLGRRRSSTTPRQSVQDLREPLLPLGGGGGGGVAASLGDCGPSGAPPGPPTPSTGSAPYRPPTPLPQRQEASPPARWHAHVSPGHTLL